MKTPTAPSTQKPQHDSSDGLLRLVRQSLVNMEAVLPLADAIQGILGLRTAKAGEVLLEPGPLMACLMVRSGSVHEFDPGSDGADAKPFRRIAGEGVLGVEFFTREAFYPLRAIAASDVTYAVINEETLDRANTRPLVRELLMLIIRGAAGDLQAQRSQLAKSRSEVDDLEASLMSEAEGSNLLRHHAEELEASLTAERQKNAEGQETVQALMAALAAEQAKSSKLEKELSLERARGTQVRSLMETYQYRNRELEREKATLAEQVESLEALKLRVRGVEERVDRQDRKIEQVRSDSDQLKLEMADINQLAGLVRQLGLSKSFAEVVPLFEMLMAEAGPLQSHAILFLRAAHMAMRKPGSGTSQPMAAVKPD